MKRHSTPILRNKSINIKKNQYMIRKRRSRKGNKTKRNVRKMEKYEKFFA